MTDSPSSLIETVARAVLTARYNLDNDRLNTNISWDTIDETTRGRYLDQARAALAAIEASGHVVVPKGPTEEMLGAADYERECQGGSNGAIYAAFLAARPRIET